MNIVKQCISMFLAYDFLEIHTFNTKPGITAVATNHVIICLCHSAFTIKVNVNHL